MKTMKYARTSGRNAFVFIVLLIIIFCQHDTKASGTISAQSQTSYQVSWEGNFTLPPQDAQGWSILTPSVDSRIIYVSSTEGDDDSAQIYSPESPEVGYDPSHPSVDIKAYATINAAIKQMRNGYPDYLLLNRGDSWNSPHLRLPYGRSAQERAVLAAYGEMPTRPLIQNSGANLSKSGYLAIVGIHFLAIERDPNSDDFVGFANVTNTKGIDGTLFYPLGGFLIEDCWFEWFGNNTLQSYTFDDNGNRIAINDVIIRRNIINDNYSTNAHAQGIYSHLVSMLLEENIFDHNGWYQHPSAEIQARYTDHKFDAEGQATMFNHNTYFSETRNTIFRNNIFLRASSIGTKFTSNTEDTDKTDDVKPLNEIKAWNILVDNNFYAEGEVGISLGGNKDQDNGPRWDNIIVANNVLTAIGRTFPTNRTLGWGIGLDDWKSGLVDGNIMTNWGDKELYTNTRGLSSGGHMSDTVFSDNIIYNIVSSLGVVNFTDNSSDVRVDGAHENITFIQNEIALPVETDGQIMVYDISPATRKFADNYYYFASTEDDWFRTTDIRTATFSDYQELTGDITTVRGARKYTDPGRTIESYLASLGYATDMESLVGELKKQSRFNWRDELTANAINDYFRDGFAVIEPGDLNADGNVDLADLVRSLRVVANTSLAVNLKADTNGDGVINLQDSLYILQTVNDSL